MVLGDGSWSFWKPCARNCFKASAAVKRVYDSNVRKVGSCWLCNSANAHRACATSGCFSSHNLSPLQAACAPWQMTPVRCSFNPNCTVSRPQPNTLSARRALPWQYFNVIAAWKARRSAPDIFELANFKSSIWYALKGKIEGSVVDRKGVLDG